MAGRDVELNLIGHDDTGHATHSAASNLDQLERKMGKFNTNTVHDLRRTNAAMERELTGLRKKLDRNRQGFARSGIGAARAFSQSFIRTISLGMLGRGGMGGVKLGGAAKVFGPAGVVAGLVFGAKVLATAGNVILAGLPLILGPAIAALPFVHLWKQASAAIAARPGAAKAVTAAEARLTAAKLRLLAAEKVSAKMGKTSAGETSARRQLALAEKSLAVAQKAQKALGNVSAQEKAITHLKAKWKGFADFVSKPMKLPFVAVLKEAGKGLDSLKKPFASLVKDIGPALKPFTRGIFDGVVGFVKALKPAMPGITAGLKAWGQQLPAIGKAFGDMLAKLLKDPKRVTKAIENTSKLVQDIISLVGDLTGAMLAISDAFTLFDSSAFGLDRATRAITTAFYTMAIGAVKAISWLLDAWATISPTMVGPALAVHRLLAGLEAAFFITKSGWASTAAAINKQKIVAKIQANIDDLETKIAAAKAKLKTVHNKKARAKIEATIKDLEAKVAAAKHHLARVQGTRTQAKIKAEITDLNAKIRTATLRLRTVHNAKTQAKIRADISQLQSALARARAELASVHGKTVTITATYKKVIQTINKGSINSGNNKTMSASDGGWAGAAGGSYRTGGARSINVEAPIIDTRVFIDGSVVRSVARSTVVDENRRAAHRARVGRR